MPVKPRVFIGSSSEALPIAEFVQLELEPIADSTIWTQDFFTVGRSILETICADASQYDFAILVFRSDDVVVSRGVEGPAARANVLFELGLFMGTLGRDRAVVLASRDLAQSLPSDFAGITTVQFTTEHPAGLHAALGPALTRLKHHIERVGLKSPPANATLEVLMPRLYKVLMQSVKDLRDAGNDAAAMDRAASEMFAAVSTEVWGAGEPMSDELILDVEGQLQDCRSILATDVLGPSAWLKPIAYRYLALQIRSYLRKTSSTTVGIFCFRRRWAPASCGRSCVQCRWTRLGVGVSPKV